MLPVYRDGASVRCIVRVGKEPIAAPWRSIGESPATVVRGITDGLGLVPIVIHSTSWRHRCGVITLTHIVVVRRPRRLGASFASFRVRPEIARGDALCPPHDLAVRDVAAHGVRHLAWLVRDDPAVHIALRGWNVALAAFRPSLFEQLGPVTATATAEVRRVHATNRAELLDEEDAG